MSLGWVKARILIRFLAIGTLVALGFFSPAAVAANDWQPPSTVYVPDAGHTVDGLFLDLWRSHQDLSGDPVTEELQPQTLFSQTGNGQTVQFFENVAFAYDANAAPDQTVQLLNLGEQYLTRLVEESPTPVVQAAMRRTTCSIAAIDCLQVAEAGHTIQGQFRDFWNRSGEADWFGLPVTESFRAPDGSYLQFFENGALRLNREGTVLPMPLGRFIAQRANLSTLPIEQTDAWPTYDESLFIPPPEPEPEPSLEREPGAWSVGWFGPGPQQGAWKEIVVSISAQSMWAYEDGELIRSSYVSTGTAEVPQTETPIGNWTILTKYELQDMQGTISNEAYFVPDVPNIMYFDNLGNALHGTYWHNNFGTPMSHGCVNLPLEVADWMFDWAPIGTAVTVIP